MTTLWARLTGSGTPREQESPRDNVLAEKPNVLIDGRNLPSQFVAAALLARELQQRGFSPQILTLGRRRLPWQVDVAEAFGVREFHQARLPKLPYRSWVRVMLGASRGLLRAYVPSRHGLLHHLLHGFTYRDLEVGDLVFDRHVRSGQASHALRPAGRPIHLLKVLFTALLTIEAIATYRKPSGLSAYSTFVYASLPGLLARQVAVDRSLAIAFAPHPHVVNAKPRRKSARGEFVRRHIDDDEMRRRADDKFILRRQGSTLNKDAMRAYSSSVLYTPPSQAVLGGRMPDGGSQPAVKTVLVAAHSLTDAVHGAGALVFRDYADWIRRTLSWAAKNFPTAEWVVKEHPYAPDYNEVGLIQTLVRRSNLRRVTYVSHAVNTQSVLDQADVVITARGTIGMEAVALGIPLVVAGSTPYSDLEIVTEPKSQAQYFEQIRSALEGQAPPPTSSQQASASLALLYEEQKESLAIRIGIAESVDETGPSRTAIETQLSHLLQRPEELLRRVLDSDFRSDLNTVLDEFEKELKEQLTVD